MPVVAMPGAPLQARGEDAAATDPLPPGAYGGPAPNLRFNFSLRDTDPMARFAGVSPGRTGAPPPGYNYWWNETRGGALPAFPGQLAVDSTGTSAHVAANSTARLALAFTGTGLYLRGAYRNATYAPGARNTSIKFTEAAAGTLESYWGDMPSGDVLGRDSGLVFGPHSVVARLGAGSGWEVTGILVETGMWAEAATLDDVHVTVYRTVDDGAMNPLFTPVAGRFGAAPALAVQGTIGGYGGEAPFAFPHVAGTGGLAFSVPANTSFLVVNGTTGPENGLVTIALDPPRPGQAVLGNRSTDDADTFSSWSGAGVLFAHPLDPQQLYNLTLFSRASAPAGDSSAHDGFADGRFRMGVHSVTAYSSLSEKEGPGLGGTAATSSFRPASTGAVAGGVVGGILALLLLLGLVWFSLRRRGRSGTRSSSSSAMSEIESSPVLLSTPFRPSFGGSSLEGPSPMLTIGHTATRTASPGGAPGPSTGGQPSPLSPDFSPSTASSSPLTSGSAAPPLATEKAHAPEPAGPGRISREAHVKGPLERATLTALEMPVGSASGFPSSPPVGDAAGLPLPSSPRDPRKDTQAVPAPRPGFPVLPDLREGSARPSAESADDAGSRHSRAPATRRGASRGRAPRRQPTVTVVEHEVDSGAYVELSPGMRREVLPPVYDPAWILAAPPERSGGAIPPPAEHAAGAAAERPGPPLPAPVLAPGEVAARQSAANQRRSPMPLRVETLGLDLARGRVQAPGSEDGPATPLTSATDDPQVASNAPLWLF